MAVLTEAVWCEPAVNKGGNTRFQLSSFSYKKGEAFYAFTPLENKKSKEESNDGTERI